MLLCSVFRPGPGGAKHVSIAPIPMRGHTTHSVMREERSSVTRLDFVGRVGSNFLYTQTRVSFSVRT